VRRGSDGAGETEVEVEFDCVLCSYGLADLQCLRFRPTFMPQCYTMMERTWLDPIPVPSKSTILTLGVLSLGSFDSPVSEDNPYPVYGLDSQCSLQVSSSSSFLCGSVLNTTGRKKRDTYMISNMDRCARVARPDQALLRTNSL
jgi:hypothetical protein